MTKEYVNRKINITVVGSGYVGMSLAVLFSQNNNVLVLDIDKNRVNKINKKESTIADLKIEDFLRNQPLMLKATSSSLEAYSEANFIVVATPTNYDEITGQFDTSSVDMVVQEALSLNANALIVIKSTIPIGHTKKLQEKFNTRRVIFSPEFLREGSALEDNLNPSRIIIGSKTKEAETFSRLLINAAEKRDIETIFMNSTEAESVKLFANTYLAMRVAFFNELDSFSIKNGLKSEEIINGICSDERIGNNYNNPSFGYGGYCLPKDTKQLLSNFDGVPQSLISSIVESNKIRKEFIASEITNMKPKAIGFYRLVMKEGSDNFRESSIQDIIKIIIASGIKVFLYEPNYFKNSYLGAKVIKNLDDFVSKSDLIVANRLSEDLTDHKDKIYSRDIFREN